MKVKWICDCPPPPDEEPNRRNERIRSEKKAWNRTEPPRTQTYINFNYSRESQAAEKRLCILGWIPSPTLILLLLQVGEWNWNSIVNIFWGRCRRVEKKCNKYAYERAQLRGGASEGARSAQRPRSGVMAIWIIWFPHFRSAAPRSSLPPFTGSPEPRF